MILFSSCSLLLKLNHRPAINPSPPIATECHNVFTLICRSNQELKERHYTFTISSEDVSKEQFLRTLCRQMAHATCRADAVSGVWGQILGIMSFV